MTTSATPTPRQFAAIPRHPTLDDARAFMEFLSSEHPDLHTAIVYAELAYANADQNFNPESQALDELDED